MKINLLNLDVLRSTAHVAGQRLLSNDEQIRLQPLGLPTPPTPIQMYVASGLDAHV